MIVTIIKEKHNLVGLLHFNLLMEMSPSDSSRECVLVGGGTKLNVLGAWQPGDDTEKKRQKGRGGRFRDRPPLFHWGVMHSGRQTGGSGKGGCAGQVICGGCFLGQHWGAGQGWGERAASGAGCRCVYENLSRWIGLPGLLLQPTVYFSNICRHTVF